MVAAQGRSGGGRAGPAGSGCAAACLRERKRGGGGGETRHGSEEGAFDRRNGRALNRGPGTGTGYRPYQVSPRSTGPKARRRRRPRGNGEFGVARTEPRGGRRAKGRCNGPCHRLGKSSSQDQTRLPPEWAGAGGTLPSRQTMRIRGRSAAPVRRCSWHGWRLRAGRTYSIDDRSELESHVPQLLGEFVHAIWRLCCSLWF